MAYAYFYPQVSNVSSYQIVSLVYYADTEEYKGFIRITDDTYPCEWMLTDLVIGDLKGNCTHLSDFKPGWQSTSPWYYKVETDKTYREDVFLSRRLCLHKRGVHLRRLCHRKG